MYRLKARAQRYADRGDAYVRDPQPAGHRTAPPSKNLHGGRGRRRWKQSVVGKRNNCEIGPIYAYKSNRPTIVAARKEKT